MFAVQKTLLAILFLLLIIPTVTMAQGWPEIYDTDQLITLNLELDNADWQTIQNDETFDLEFPAQFWIEGEAPILVSLRRKSGDPLHEGGGYTKVSLKVDINEYVDGQTWHDIKKLSLENGDDQDVVTECLAWYLHRLASGPEGYGYTPGLASWVSVIVNGVNIGVYVNVEQPDKQFFRNRDMYISGATWLYKMSDINQYDLKFGNGDSPTFQALCYEPFHPTGSACVFPGDELFATELNDLINMRGMLTLATMDGFTSNNDALFTHGKNAFLADFTTGRKRMYLPWDLDSAMSGGGGGDSFYPSGDEYSDFILAVPEFIELFDNIMSAMLGGPLNMDNIGAFLDVAEPMLTSALEADPNSQIDGSIAEHFAGLRERVSERIADALEHFSITSVPVTPSSLHLAQNYPNPFNPKTSIDFSLQEAGVVSLKIYDVSGHLVRTLRSGFCGSGDHNITWDGLDDGSAPVGNGVYFYRLDAGGATDIRKMVMIR